jgi:HPt (histidine-containing phosphotransfer) domain-containing protein
MHAHLSAGDYAQLAVVAHNIQGVAGFLGAMRICSLAAEIAAAQRRGSNGEEIAPLALALIEAQAELAVAVQAVLGDSPPARA